ncbi:MAG: hypothetical protein ACREKM_08270 [Longimicrobiales bacterium]
MTRTDGAGRLRFAGALLLAATFAVGALGGLAYAHFGDREAAAESAERECHDDDDRPSYLDRLELDVEQQERVDAILQSRKEQMHAFWDENGPRMEQIVDSARAEIRGVLTEAQRAEVDRMRAERRARHEREKQECAEQRGEKQKEEGAA